MAVFDFFNRRKTETQGEMTFIDHLEELRWHLVRSVIAVVICAIVVMIFSSEIVEDVLMAPTRADFVSARWLCTMGQSIGIGDALCFTAVDAKFLENTMTGQFLAYFTLGFMGGFVIAFPYIFWEFWRFVKPALSEKELKKTRGVIFWVSLLFFSGVAFGYFILTPFMVNFYFNFKLSSQIVIMPSFSDYLENLIYTTVGIGVLFQMPLLVMVLARIGVVTAKFLRKYRRHALVIIVIAAAIITPSTDPFSLTIVTIPLYLLFEASIMVAARINKQQEKAAKEWS
ncbi:MAG TPA: twin-arginine translocase subunit TatC [Chitinophagaceae bacterium]|nr:twin-arginine translocase subunit TatC [Chitinophagaceae bacterium]HPN58287.1 twin-arginine translocase subunit TatC [Chitinophagaceae bacterium]